MNKLIPSIIFPVVLVKISSALINRTGQQASAAVCRCSKRGFCLHEYLFCSTSMLLFKRVTALSRVTGIKGRASINDIRAAIISLVCVQNPGATHGWFVKRHFFIAKITFIWQETILSFYSRFSPEPASPALRPGHRQRLPTRQGNWYRRRQSPQRRRVQRSLPLQSSQRGGDIMRQLRDIEEITARTSNFEKDIS